MQPTTVACLALLCLVAFISTGSAHSQDDSAPIAVAFEFNIKNHDALELPKGNLPQTRGRCKTMGRCVHDTLCDGHCKQFRYKDGSCSGDFCICCA